MRLTRSELFCLAVDAMERARLACEDTDDPELVIEHLQRALEFLTEAQK